MYRHSDTPNKLFKIMFSEKRAAIDRITGMSICRPTLFLSFKKSSFVMSIKFTCSVDLQKCHQYNQARLLHHSWFKKQKIYIKINFMRILSFCCSSDPLKWCIRKLCLISGVAKHFYSMPTCLAALAIVAHYQHSLGKMSN